MAEAEELFVDFLRSNTYGIIDYNLENRSLVSGNPAKNWIFPDMPRCFTNSAEVLTEKGWKNISEIKEGEIIMTCNIQTLELEYQPIIKKIEQNYSGEMIRLKNFQIDTLITPNHKFLVKYPWNIKYKLIEANNLKVGHRLLRVGIWKGKIIDNIEIPEYKTEKSYFKINYKSFNMDIKKFMALLGIFISEGNVEQNGYIRISQVKKETRNKIRKLIKSIGLRFSEDKETFFISDRRLGQLFKKYGQGCRNKFIPKEIKDLSSDNLEILLKWLILGDGCLVDKGTDSYEYYTTSKQLSDDVMEIAIKTGKATKYRIKTNPTKCYVVKIYGKRYRDMRIFKEKISRELFNGKVYCVNTPNSTLIIRDNNKCYISGNSDLNLNSYPRVAVTSISESGELQGIADTAHYWQTIKLQIDVFAKKDLICRLFKGRTTTTINTSTPYQNLGDVQFRI